MKKKIVDIETHSFFRMLERGLRYNLDYYETKERAFDAVRKGRSSKKHLSKNHKTYYKYYKDNLSFYVVCKEKEFEDYIRCVIKTVIIEKGRT